MILAAEVPRHTGEQRYLDAIERPKLVLGDNDIGLAMADPTTGAASTVEPASVNRGRARMTSCG
jgi:hypothetical protein